MYQIVIVPKDTGATACMYYKTEDKARTEIQAIHEIQTSSKTLVLNLKDDYGFVLTMPLEHLCYALLIDCAKSAALHGGNAPPAQRHILDA